MLDPVTFARVRPTNYIVPAISQLNQPGKLTAEDKILLCPVLYGFSLGDKKWGT